MDCEHCNELLLDLAYDELDEVRAAAVRKHTDGCADCRTGLQRISRGRSLARQLNMEQAPAVSVVLRAAIEAATTSPAAISTASVPPAEERASSADNVVSLRRSPRGVARWLDRVGEFAMRRQVAMAAVFLLMIGVGLVFYQTDLRPSESLEQRRPDVVPAVEIQSETSPTVALPETSGAPRRGNGLARSTGSSDRQGSTSASSNNSRANSGSGSSSDYALSGSSERSRGSSGQGAAVTSNGTSTVTPERGAVAQAVESGEVTAPSSATSRIPAQVQSPIRAEQGSSSEALEQTEVAANEREPTRSREVTNEAESDSNAQPSRDEQIARLRARLAAIPSEDRATRSEVAISLASLLRQAGRQSEAENVLRQNAPPSVAASNSNVQVAEAGSSGSGGSSGPSAARPATVRPPMPMPSNGSSRSTSRPRRAAGRSSAYGDSYNAAMEKFPAR
jgi:hypothetical protein